MVTALRSELGAAVSWPDPRGGFFLWARLPGNLDAERLLDRAVRHGVVYVAGEVRLSLPAAASLSSAALESYGLAFVAPIFAT